MTHQLNSIGSNVGVGMRTVNEPMVFSMTESGLSVADAAVTKMSESEVA